MKQKVWIVYYRVNLSKRPMPARYWAKKSKTCYSVAEAEQFIKDNGLKKDHWTHIEESELSDILSDVFCLPLKHTKG